MQFFGSHVSRSQIYPRATLALNWKSQSLLCELLEKRKSNHSIVGPCTFISTSGHSFSKCLLNAKVQALALGMEKGKHLHVHL